MGNCDSDIYCSDIDRNIITPVKIPYTDDVNLLNELKESGFVFNKTYNVVWWIGSGRVTLWKLAEVNMPYGYGLLKMENDYKNTGYYIINSKYFPCYYIWTNIENHKMMCGIKRVEGNTGKNPININEYGLYNGWWMHNTAIREIQEKEYTTKMNNYKNNLANYNNCTKYDNQIIEKEFLKITNEYNTLIYYVPADKLLANGIFQPPARLKSTKETMFSS